MTPDEAAEFFDPSNGLHANRGETSAVLAINPSLVDMDRANAEFPPFPDVTNPAPVHTALDRKSTRLNSSHVRISYAVFCLKKKNTNISRYNLSSVISPSTPIGLMDSI